MGSILSSSLSAVSIACQSLTCCCSATSCLKSSGDGVGVVSSNVSKGIYVTLLGLTTILAFYLRSKGDKLKITLGAWDVHCSDDSSSGNYNIYCKGDAAVYRLSFVLSVFFFICSLSSLFKPIFHVSFWGIKLILLVFLSTVCMFIPNSIFDNTGYAWIARIGSVLFILLQVLILVDFSYEWNDSWIEFAFPSDGSEHNKKYMFAILLTSFLIYTSICVSFPVVLSFYGQCTIGIVFTYLTLFFIIILTSITLARHKLIEEQPGSILPASIVSGYSVFMLWSALDSNPDDICRPHTSIDSNHQLKVVIGLIFATISLMYTTYTTSNNIQHILTGEQVEERVSEDDVNNDESMKKPLISENEQETSGYGTVIRDDNSYDDNYGYLDKIGVYNGEKVYLFHLIMLSASMYIAMLLTNWGVNDYTYNDSVTVSNANLWVKIASQWVMILLYIWTVIAPAILGDYRDFD